MTDEWKKKRRNIIIALVIYAAVIALEHTGTALGIPESILHNHLIMMIPYLVPYLIAGGPVIIEAAEGIAHLEIFDEAFLMTLATFGAFAIGENAEACAVMLFFQVGELFEDYAEGKSRQSIKDLMEIAPEIAHVLKADGTVADTEPGEVSPGDILFVRPGEKIPVDGTVLEGSGMTDTSALTGESVPRPVNPGDPIISGCINGEDVLKIRADKRYSDSTVSRILEMVEEAADKKSRTESFISRFAARYTPAVVAGAVILAVVPSVITGHPAVWIKRACTFLVISCPCALVVSVPLAFFGGIGAASRIGVLVKGSNFLEMMANVDTMVFDKTGTLTKGEFKVQNTECAPGVTPGELIGTAAIAESVSNHPIAVSVREAAGNITENPDEGENISGRGIRAISGGHVILAGNEALMRDHGIAFIEGDPASTCVYVARDGEFMGAILISDAVKPEAEYAVSAMKDEGVKNFVMLTGDRKETAEHVAETLGISETYAELLPQDKVLKVEEMLGSLRPADGSESRKKLVFVGDGINDAPVLTRADAGIAMGSMGSDAAIEAADIVIMDDDLRRIPAVIGIARRTLGISRQNIVFALLVKFLILILGALGLAGMWAAVFSDVGVAMLCILNSMRMLRMKESFGAGDITPAK